jgi:hypothetical protein
LYENTALQPMEVAGEWQSLENGSRWRMAVGEWQALVNVGDYHSPAPRFLWPLIFGMSRGAQFRGLSAGGTIRPYVAMTGYGSKCMGTPPQLVDGWSPRCRRPRRRQPGHRKCTPSATYNIKPFSECPTAQSAVAVLEAIKQLARDRWQ